MQAEKEAKEAAKIEAFKKSAATKITEDEMQRQYDAIEEDKLKAMPSWKKALYLKRAMEVTDMWEACGIGVEEKAELLELPPWQCSITLKKKAQATPNKRVAEIVRQAAQAAENMAEVETKQALGGKFPSAKSTQEKTATDGNTTSGEGSRRNSMVLENSVMTLLAKRREEQAEADAQAEARSSAASAARGSRFAELKSGKPKKSPEKKAAPAAVQAAEEEKLKVCGCWHRSTVVRHRSFRLARVN